ncbi:AAA family ATPase [Paenibacillus sp. P32E]|uniref:AAA family ATPase n=1 Tax=Paenibacillus sp. P32E TaxID=1349434 RepID=UPI00093B2AB7|nr:AAA family ATPase [Paenibacillus sp. P32E]OKP85837.1 chromosome segregation protein SMC [Paenibacillus sp. P32E]
MNADNISIENIGGIKKLDIEFNNGVNLICGMNGVGKSTILECIAHSFGFTNSSIIKRNQRSMDGNWTLSIDGKKITFSTEAFHPFEQQINYNASFIEDNLQVIYVKDQRQIEYHKNDGIRSDEDRTKEQYQFSIINGLRPETIKSWFSNRVLFEPHGSLSEAESANIKLAKKCFSLLDESVKYERINHTSLDLIIDTPRGSIYFEYLSSGFKSALFILLGLIKEIEFNTNPKIKASDFTGIILIDEADAHLHPHWQGPFLNAIKDTFSNAQIIITTHSPHMIQAAGSEELIVLGIDKDGEVKQLDTIKSEYGFKGWTVEEILEDVMGLAETRSDEYLITKRKFESALDAENYEIALESYKILEEMLHPRSPMRKVYQLQLGSLG